MDGRRHVHYSGRVQGVGFRYTVRALARGRPVSGFVRNCPDGRVEVVVEGQAGEVEAFLAAVREEMADYIGHVEVQDEPPTGEFSGFAVAF
ncbi:MAG TPA: acylphosphatase [Phycisphaerae bacterium]|nr:acylphosphatase [Phycisphaerae bacterium]